MHRNSTCPECRPNSYVKIAFRVLTPLWPLSSGIGSLLTDKLPVTTLLFNAHLSEKLINEKSILFSIDLRGELCVIKHPQSVFVKSSIKRKVISVRNRTIKYYNNYENMIVCINIMVVFINTFGSS